MQSSDELVLLERVFLRVGSADTDEQLEATLAKFLPPVLQKLSSSDEAVRKKVMELLIHVNKRVKSRPRIQLPVDAFLLQYQDPQASTFVTNFSIIYIKLGYPRLDIDKQIALAPTLLNSLENKPTNQQDVILQLLMPVWGHLKIPSSGGTKSDLFHLDDKPKTTQLLLEFMMDVLILSYGVYVPRPDTTSPSTTPPPSLNIPPGLSEAALKRIVGDGEISAEQLEKSKLGILQFLASGILTEQEVVCHFVVAFADSRHSVATSADYELKKMTSSIDWDCEKTVKCLYHLYLGTPKTKEKTIKANQVRSAVSTRVRLKLFPYLLRSKMAATMFPFSVQVIFEALFGKTTNQKLKMFAIQFVHHLCQHCPQKKLAPVAQVLMNGMSDVIKNNPDDGKMKIIAYTALGKLGHAIPALVMNDVSLLQKLFDAISQEQNDARLGIQEALAMLSESYKLSAPSDKLLIEALLMLNIEKDDSLLRSVTVNYAATIFPPNHVASRYLLLLASGDIKEDNRAVPRQAIRDPLSSEPVNVDDVTDRQDKLPPFVAMTKYITQQAELRMTSAKRAVIGHHVLPFTPAVYSEIVKYLRVCLAYTAGVNVDMDDFTPSHQAPPPIGIRCLLTTGDVNEVKAVESYLTHVKALLKATEDATALYCLLEMVAICPETLCQQFSKEIPWLKKFVLSPKEERRTYGSQLYALVQVHLSPWMDVVETIDEFVSELSTQTMDVQHGLILTIGHMVGLLLHGQTDAEHNEQLTSTVASAVVSIVSYLSSDTISLQMASCSALAEIGRNGSLMLPPGTKDDPAEGELTKYSVVSKLLTMTRSSNTSDKVKEKTAICLGYICTGERDFTHRRHVIQGLMESVQTKQTELHFTVGEALLAAAEGHTSPARRNLWAETENDYRNSAGGENDVGWYLNLILSQYVCSDNPLHRQASCVWLLTLVKRCGHHPDVQVNLAHVQTAFMHLLSEKEEIIQDIASKGLGLVYDQCSEEQKSNLVSELVDTLMTGKRSKRVVTNDSELFQEGSMGKTPDGAGLSTYKELCSIASDLNQPDLIYKFLHLANHQAMWNSRKGAAFGFSTIVAQAGDQMAPYLPQIVPKLYRYQFDPNPKVQRAMSSIWNALVKDNKKTVELYKHEILADLVKNLTSSQWRVRESSCYAVSDILSGRQIDEAIELLPELWTSCLHVMDDIKESVRKAADSACKTLSKLSISVCDAHSGSAGERATRLVLPCLLHDTINSQVKEVRAIGLSTLLEISKKAGALLKPHIPLLVIALLEAVSGLEPQMLNYLSLHAGSSDQSQEQLDNARIAASKSSPMMETVNRCVQYVDGEVLKELVPRLCDLIKSGIGVSTKVGCANFVVSLVRQCTTDLTQHTGHLITALTNGLLDRNSSVRKANAAAIGNLVKVSKDGRVEKLLLKLQSWYTEKNDDTAKRACRVTLWSISQNSPDALRRHAAIAMPLAFFAMHEAQKDPEKGANEISQWEEVWSDGTPGTEAGLKLYLTEIIVILKNALDSQSWEIKAQAASAMSSVASKLSSSLSGPQLRDLLSALLTGLSGRTWTGKESLLKAISTICTSCKVTVDTSSQPNVTMVIDAVLRECKKDKLEYKREALTCVGNVIKAYNLDYFDQVWDILTPHFFRAKIERVGDDEDEDTSREAGVEYDECVYRVMGQVWPELLSTQEKRQTQFCELLTSTLSSTSWKVQVVILQTLHKFITRSVILKDATLFKKKADEHRAVVESIMSSVTPLIDDLKYCAVRSESLTVIEALVHAVAPLPAAVTHSRLEQLRNQLRAIVNDNKHDLHDRAKHIHDLVNSVAI